MAVSCKNKSNDESIEKSEYNFISDIWAKASGELIHFINKSGGITKNERIWAYVSSLEQNQFQSFLARRMTGISEFQPVDKNYKINDIDPKIIEESNSNYCEIYLFLTAIL